jgi:cell division protein FtsL
MTKTRRGKSKLERFIFSTKFVILVVFTIMLFLGYLRISLEGTKLGYEISANKKAEDEIINEKSYLEAEYMTLRSPQRIGDLAHKLGFKYPTQDDVFYREQATVVGEKR